MWANYYSSFPLPDVFQSKARAMSWATDYSATVKTVPVAVIPLDDPMIVHALAALGIRLGKGGRK